MVFSSAVFLFLFLPVFLLIHFGVFRKWRNLLILLVSLLFYAWGEHTLVVLMMCSILLNYGVGRAIEARHELGKSSQLILVLGVALNLSALIYFKYIHFIVENLSQIGIKFSWETSKITLPIGISFFTFQGISYLIDVYRRDVVAQRNLINLGMYISMFPQLIAGPIVRYTEISGDILNRKITFDDIEKGLSRFMIGFVKKVLIANEVGLIADKVFALEGGTVSTPLAWIGIVCYTLQIYYDFSGYSDMAIGLGRMLGFKFNENFMHPYISTSIKEFWRRWHISLSSWFKDYLYIPLGGNRKGPSRTYVNLLIVFFITGLWHGASWNFVVWGLFHGFFIVFEKFKLWTLPRFLIPIKWLYTIMVVMIGWVLFRAETFADALSYYESLFLWNKGSNFQPYMFVNNYVWVVIFIGILFSTPVRRTFINWAVNRFENPGIIQNTERIVLVALFILAIFEMTQSTYNPFIYYRF